MATTVETPSLPSTFDEFKLRKKGEAPTEPATEPKPPAEPKPGTSETAADSETAETTTQEGQQQPADDKKPPKRTLEARLKDLRSQGKHDEADKILREAVQREEQGKRSDLEKELQELRTRKPAPETTTETAKPAAAPAPETADDLQPKEADYDGSEGKAYSDFIADTAAWKNRQRDRADRQKQQQATLRDSVNQKLAKARQAHADFDQVTQGDAKTGTGFLMTPSMQQFLVYHPDGAEVLYKLAGDRAEHARIFALDPTMQLAEMGILAKGLAAPATAAASPPEKPKPPVSRVPAPPPKTGGTEQAPPKTTGDARTYSEFKRIKNTKR